MASLIRTRLSDLCTRLEVNTFGKETFGYSCTPGRKPSYLCPVGPRTTDVPHPGASTFIVHHSLNNSVFKSRARLDTVHSFHLFVQNVHRAFWFNGYTNLYYFVNLILPQLLFSLFSDTNVTAFEENMWNHKIVQGS